MAMLVDFLQEVYSPTRSHVIELCHCSTLGNAIDFGNLGAANGGTAGFHHQLEELDSGGNIAISKNKCYGICNHGINWQCN